MQEVWGGPIPDKQVVIGWKCAACPWFYEAPGIYLKKYLPKFEREARQEFDNHDCFAESSRARKKVS
jgi:hypothetical protein